VEDEPGRAGCRLECGRQRKLWASNAPSSALPGKQTHRGVSAVSNAAGRGNALGIEASVFRVEYTLKVMKVIAEQYDGSDSSAITRLVGSESSHITGDGVLQVKNTDGEWFTVYGGWWVSKSTDGSIVISTNASFRSHL
jgi:hypothetical protein